MLNILDIVVKIGGLVGIIAFVWKFVEEKKSFLTLKLEVKSDDKQYTALTQVQNSNKASSKKISNAFLLISLEDDYSPVEAGKKIASHLNLKIKIHYTDHFEMLKSNTKVYLEKRIAFIPLSYYYSENASVADETLTYRCSINTDNLKNGTYSVRFYLFGEGRLVRSIQDLLTVES